MSSSPTPPPDDIQPPNGSSGTPGPANNSPDDQEELVLWLLGELNPAEAARVEARWADRPQEVARMRRFLGVTMNVGEQVRTAAQQVQAPRVETAGKRGLLGTPGSLSRSRSSFGAGAAAAGDADAPDRGAQSEKPKGFLGVLATRVPRRVLPVAILAPIVVVFIFAITHFVLNLRPAGTGTMLEILTPSVLLYDQGQQLAPGPLRVGTQVRMTGEKAAARISWDPSHSSQAVISGPVRLLVTEASVGVLHQEGKASYEIAAKQAPMHIMTPVGAVEVMQANMNLNGDPTELAYDLKSGRVRVVSTGQWIAAPATGVWGGAPVQPAVQLAQATPAPASTETTTTVAVSRPNRRTPRREVAANEDAPAVAVAETTTTAERVIAGHVLRTDNSGVEGAQVTLFVRDQSGWGGRNNNNNAQAGAPGSAGPGGSPAGNTGGRRRSSRDALTTTTLADGSFRFTRFRSTAQTAVLIVTHPQLVSGTEETMRSIPVGTDDVVATLYETSTIRGRALPPKGSSAVGVLTVEVVNRPGGRGGPGGGWAMPMTDLDLKRMHIDVQADQFLITGLRPGNYQVRLTSDLGQTGQSEDIRLGLEATENVDIQLIPGGSLSGRVVDAQTQVGIPGAKVEVRHEPRGFGRGRGGRGNQGPGGGFGNFGGPRAGGDQQGGTNGGGRGGNTSGAGGQQAGGQSTGGFAGFGGFTNSATGGAGQAVSATGDESSQVVVSTVTDDTGNYSIPGVPPGSFIVVATASGYLEDRESVEINSGKNKEVTLQLPKTYGIIAGRVVDPNGNPISSARVRADQTPNALYEAVEALSDMSGNYSLSVPPGHWNLRAQAPNDASSFARDTAELKGSEKVKRDFTLFASVKLSGRVTRGGEPLANENVMIMGVGGGGDARRANTDDDGNYSASLRPGDYAISILNQRRATVTLESAPVVQNIAILDNSLSGLISDAETKQPIPRAQVVLEKVGGDNSGTGGGGRGGARGGNQTRAGRNGTYEFRALDPGTYRVLATADGYAEGSSTNIVIPANDEAEHKADVSLSPAAVYLEVTATDAGSGKPLAGVSLQSVKDAATGKTALASTQPRETDDTGFFVVTGLSPGTYSLTFSKRGDGSYLSTTSRSVAITAEGPNKLSVSLATGGGLTVFVRRTPASVDGVASPVPNATVKLTPPPNVQSDGYTLTRKTDTDGRARFPMLPGGSYAIDVTASDGSQGYGTSAVEPGKQAEAEVRLPPK